MDIAAMVSAKPADTASAQTSGSTDKSGAELGGFINTLVEAVRKVKSDNSDNRNNSSASVNAAGDKKVAAPDEDVTLDDMDAAMAALPYMQSLGLEDREALERISVLVANGTIDSELLSELGSEGLDQLAQWVLEGAGGLFDEFDPSQVAVDNAAQVGDSEIPDFGLKQAAQAIVELENLRDKIAGVEIDSDKLPEILSQMTGLSEDLDVAEIDNIAQQITAGLTELAGEAGLDADQMSLRDIVKSIPETDLRDLMDKALASEGASQKLPEMPETVLKSLCIDVISVDNKEVDAADIKLSLLDALDNNQALREELLRQVTQAATEGEIQQSFNRDALEKAVENLMNQQDFDQKVLKDIDGFDLENTAFAGLDSAGIVELADEEIATALNKNTEVASVEQLTEIVEDVEVVEVAAPQVGETVKVQNDSQNQNQPQITDIAADIEGELSTLTAGNNTGTGGEGQSGGMNQNANSSVMAAANSLNGDNQSAESELEGIDALTGKEFVLPEASDDSAAGVKDAATVSKESSFPSESNIKYSDMAENIQKLEKMLKVSSGSNLKNITLQLTPDELGKITINVEYKDGQVYTTIKTENETARDLLLSGSEQLKKNLEASGVKIETFEVNVERDGYDDGKERNQESWNAAQQERNKNKKNSAGGVDGVEAQENPDDISEEKLGIVDGSVNLIA